MKGVITLAYPSKGCINSAWPAMFRMLAIPEDLEQFQVIQVAGADVDVARNKLVEHARGDWIFWIDDDVLVPPDTIIKLYSHKKDIVSGVYYARERPHFPQLFHKSEKDDRRYDALWDVPENELIEVDACGMGCILIRKKVFDKLKKPYFDYRPRGEKELRQGEDYYFCEKAKEAGFKIYADTSIVGRHIGVDSVGPEHWEMSKRKLDLIKEKVGEEKFNEMKEKSIEMRDKGLI